jgi:hypothetical protein
MDFVSAGGLALSVGEVMLKSDTILYHSENNLRFSFDSPMYIYFLQPIEVDIFRLIGTLKNIPTVAKLRGFLLFWPILSCSSCKKLLL